MVKNFKHGDNVPIQLIVDASDNMSASSAINVAQLAINKKQSKCNYLIIQI